MMRTFLLSGIVLFVVLSPVVLGAGIFQSSYTADFSFSDSLGGTTMTVAFDGTNYWSSSGGSSSGTRYARYDINGTNTGTYQPGIDFRSVFTDQDSAPVYARGYSSRQIRRQSSPGSFTNDISLSGGSIDSQSAVVFSADGTEFLARKDAAVERWNRSGTYLGAITLSGYGSVGSETDYPQDRNLAIAGDYILTYVSGTLSAWDQSGTRVGTTTLVSGGSTFDSNFSMSFANGMVFVVSTAGGTWRGYAISELEPTTPTPSPTATNTPTPTITPTPTNTGTPPPIPATNAAGAGILLIFFSLLVLRRRRR